MAEQSPPVEQARCHQSTEYWRWWWKWRNQYLWICAFTKNGGSASIGIGGAGGSGGAANNVFSSVITTGSANNNQIDFKTVGNESVAITAQSIGGGGGNGG